jgi:hypothetical protein
MASWSWKVGIASIAIVAAGGYALHHARIYQQQAFLPLAAEETSCRSPAMT